MGIGSLREEVKNYTHISSFKKFYVNNAFEKRKKNRKEAFFLIT